MVVLAVVVPLLCAVSLPVVVHLHLLRVCTSRMNEARAAARVRDRLAWWTEPEQLAK
ncbi:uncharacterized protein V6R79_011017 [Siganus canaliculatus]